MSQCRLEAPIRAILDKPDGEQVSVTIPAWSVLHTTSQTSTLLGLVDVYWIGRHYWVSLRDLLKNAELVESA